MRRRLGQGRRTPPHRRRRAAHTSTHPQVANAKEARIRDQAAFNMLTKANGAPKQYKVDGKWQQRIFTAANGDGTIKLGVLPLSRFLNGHTFFVQHAHTLPNAAPPLSVRTRRAPRRGKARAHHSIPHPPSRSVQVHMTYQFAEGSKFAYGKRQRLREAGLWLVDDDAYFSGRCVWRRLGTGKAHSRRAPLTPLPRFSLSVGTSQQTRRRPTSRLRRWVPPWTRATR